VTRSRAREIATNRGECAPVAERCEGDAVVRCIDPSEALDRRDPFGDRIYLDPAKLVVMVDSALDDAETRAEARGWLVPHPDGLWEWCVRRDFVRTLPPSRAKTKLGTTLAGPKTRRRFEVAIAAAGGRWHADFAQWRRTRLRRYAARVVRFAVAFPERLRVERATEP